VIRAPKFKWRRRKEQLDMSEGLWLGDEYARLEPELVPARCWGCGEVRWETEERWNIGHDHYKPCDCPGSDEFMGGHGYHFCGEYVRQWTEGDDDAGA
jgi:hypothetical protein